MRLNGFGRGSGRLDFLALFYYYLFLLSSLAVGLEGTNLFPMRMDLREVASLFMIKSI